MARIAVLFLPFIIGLAWRDLPQLSIAWSLAGSFFIAAIAQTEWFRQSRKRLRVREHLLRPATMFHLYFLAYHVVGGAFHALDAAGYGVWGRIAEPSEYRLSMIAAAQQWMLLAHASVTAGMKIAGFRYDEPRYVIPRLPPYTLIILSFICLGVGTVFMSFPALFNLGGRVLSLGTTAVLVEFALSIWRRRFDQAVITSPLLVYSLVQQGLSGWKGPMLYSVLMVGAMLYPRMPRRVVLGCAAFLLFWALYLHPFGIALRPLLWYEGVPRQEATAISLDYALTMPLDQRLDQAWKMMAGRANDLYQFQKYLEYVPGTRPYFGLELVKQALMAFVPRLLWPDKPDLERLAMVRVYEAGVVSEQAVVSAKSNYYQDAYMSGGWPAIIVAGLFLGVLMMLIGRLCERLFGGYEIGTCLIYTGLFAWPLHFAQNFEFFVGGILTGFPIVLGLFYAGQVMGWIQPSPSIRRRAADQIGLAGRRV
jgi:hypothetical protein